jgi:hypothetical protein
MLCPQADDANKNITLKTRIFMSDILKADAEQVAASMPQVQVAEIPYQATVPEGKTFWILGPEGYFRGISSADETSSNTQPAPAGKRRLLILIKASIQMPENETKTPADLKKSLRTDKSWDTAFNEAIQVIQSRKNWPQTPEAVVKAYWNARAEKNYEEMRILWPGSGSWNWAQICQNDPDVKYVFGPASKSGTEVPYASENHFKQTGSYNLTMRLSYTDTKKGKRYYIWSGN